MRINRHLAAASLWTPRSAVLLSEMHCLALARPRDTDRKAPTLRLSTTRKQRIAAAIAGTLPAALAAARTSAPQRRPLARSPR